MQRHLAATAHNVYKCCSREILQRHVPWEVLALTLLQYFSLHKIWLAVYLINTSLNSILSRDCCLNDRLVKIVSFLSYCVLLITFVILWFQNIFPYISNSVLTVPARLLSVDKDLLKEKLVRYVKELRFVCEWCAFYGRWHVTHDNLIYYFHKWRLKWSWWLETKKITLLLKVSHDNLQLPIISIL